MVGETEVGVMGSSARGRGLAMLHLGRVGDALAAGHPSSPAASRWRP